MDDEQKLLNLISDIRDMETESEKIADKISDLEAELSKSESDLKHLKVNIADRRIELDDLVYSMTQAEDNRVPSYEF